MIKHNFISKRLIRVIIPMVFVAVSFFTFSVEVHANASFHGNHFYTTSWSEAYGARWNSGFQSEDSYDSIYVLPQQIPNSYQLYRYYNFQTGDHFYATDDADRQRALSNGYVDESSYDIMFVFKQPLYGAKQLFRYYNPHTHDHFYATDDADRQRALGGGYVDESSYDTIYVLPYSQNIQNVLTVRLYRLFHPDLNYYLFCVSLQQQQEVQEWANTEEQAYANAQATYGNFIFLGPCPTVHLL